MEAQTGVALVHRTPRGSALTADGAVIAEWAARLLDVAAGLDAGIAALRADRRARLRISASSTIAEQLLPGWLASFRAAAPPGRPAPDIVLTAANTEQVIGHVAAGSADIGFTEGPRRPAGLRSKIIGQDRLVVVVAPGHRWARRRAVTAAELAPAPLVIREGGSGTRDTLAAALAAALGSGAAQAPAALSVSTTAAVRAAVLAAAAPAVLSELARGRRRPGRRAAHPDPSARTRPAPGAASDLGQHPRPARGPGPRTGRPHPGPPPRAGRPAHWLTVTGPAAAPRAGLTETAVRSAAWPLSCLPSACTAARDRARSRGRCGPRARTGAGAGQVTGLL
jgi:DNA-binding transcriptional LysR family regulator